MISNNTVQAGIITYLKSKAALTVLLANTYAVEVRENQWQGDEFAYPAVRVDLGTQVPDADCEDATLSVGILCFSESNSSKEADTIAGVVNTLLHRKQFTSGTVRYLFYSDGLVPAVRQDKQTWRSEALFRCTIQPA